MAAEYPKFIYSREGTAHLIATEAEAAAVPTGDWYEDPEGRDPFVQPVTPPSAPDDAPADPLIVESQTTTKKARRVITGG